MGYNIRMEIFPPALIVPCVFILGAVIGSFLNVVILRLHTGRSLNDRSHCATCGTALSWYELVPLLSYAALLGRCRSCGARISPQYFLVELATGTAFALVFLAGFDAVTLILSLLAVSVLIVIAGYDLKHLIIPDEAVALLAALAFALLGYEAWLSEDLWHALEGLLASACAFLFFAGLWYFSGGRWLGFGDAKLAIPLGMLVGLSGVFSLIVFSFWIGAAVSLCILGIQALVSRGQSRLPFLRARLRMKSEVPFAPFLILSFLLVYLYGANALHLMMYALL